MGSVHGWIGKAWPRHQREQNRLGYTSVSSGAQCIPKAEPCSITATPQNKGTPSTSRSPLSATVLASDRGNTVTSEFFPSDPPAHLLLGKERSREQLNNQAGGHGELETGDASGAAVQQHQSAAGSKSWLQQTMSQFNLNLTASDRRKAVRKQEKRGGL